MKRKQVIANSRSPLRPIVQASAPVAVAVVFLSAWEITCRLLGVPRYILPCPSVIAGVIGDNAAGLWSDMLVTMAEALAGFLLANVASLVFAVLFVRWTWLEGSLYPYIIALKSVPVVAMAPLLILWCGYGFMGKILMASIVAFFPLVVNATLGLREVNRSVLEYFHSVNATEFQVLIKLRFPNAIPYIVSALKVSSTLAVLGAIIAELTGATQGLGFRILIAFYNIDTPMLFASIIVSSLLGILFFLVIVLSERVWLQKYFLENSLRKESRR